jgi:uncharacterized membrane protein
LAAKLGVTPRVRVGSGTADGVCQLEDSTKLREGLAQTGRKWGWRHRIVATLALSVITLYILATPAGLLDKADWVAYAICHRIPSHSLLLEARPLPLCARCTGTYLGAMLAISYFLATRPRVGSLPPLPVLLALLAFSGAWALDGVNSYLHLSGQASGHFPLQPVYEPQNWLRLLTGGLHGLMMASLFFPIAMGTFWRETQPTRVLRNYKELGGLVLLVLVSVTLALTGSPIVLYPLALISSAGVLVMLTLVNTVMVLILARRENTAAGWRDLVLPLLAGLALSFVLIGLVGVLRHALTGTMTGLPGLPQ